MTRDTYHGQFWYHTSVVIYQKIGPFDYFTSSFNTKAILVLGKTPIPLDTALALEDRESKTGSASHVHENKKLIRSRLLNKK